jgi:hypothetical protein
MTVDTTGFNFVNKSIASCPTIENRSGGRIRSFFVLSLEVLGRINKLCRILLKKKRTISLLSPNTDLCTLYAHDMGLWSMTKAELENGPRKTRTR